MKKTYILSFLIILASSNIFSQSGWFITRPFPNTREDINDIHFLNSNTGFLVTGEYAYPYYSYGRLYKTTNSGFNWNRTFLDSLYYLNKIYFIDNNTGFVFGSKLYKTTNSGNNWNYIGGFGFLALYFINNNTGFACGPADEGRPFIYKSINGGNSWSLINNDLSGYYTNLLDIYFKNELTGLVAGFGTCAKTTNGGVNWIYKLPRGYVIYTDLEVVNDSTYFITGNNQSALIQKSSNSGETWSVTSTQFSQFASVESLDFTGTTLGYAIGSEGLIMTSTNTGNNWTQIPNFFLTVRNSSSFNRVSFELNSTGFIVGDNCSLARTSNSGSNWEILIRGDTLNAVHFFNRNFGFSAGSKGHLIKTTNGGINWSDVQSGTTNTIKDIYFKDSLIGLYIGYYGTVGKTTNSGLNWFVQSLNSSVVLQDLYGRNDTCLAIGTNGKIYKTSNFGNNWIEKSSGTTLRLNSICLRNGIFFQIVGDSGVVLRSSDFGENWQSAFVSPSKRLNSICFSNLNIGFIVGDTGRVFKTTNGGLNWNLEQPITGNNLKFIKFINQNTGYIIGSRSTTMKTTNGGINWGFQSMGIYHYNDNNRIFSIDTANLYIVGENSYVFKSTDGGGIINYPIGINPISNEIPEKYSLHQNYPNPFNPITKIKFDIPSVNLPLQGGDREGVLLKIYDLLGREVTTLVNEQLKPGSYEVDWDGTGFASGVYFYSLVTKRYTETKRMVLVK